MKKLTILVATATALALASTPAFADNNNANANANSKKIQFEINGTLKSVDTATASVVVTVKTVSQPHDGKAVAAAILKAGDVKFTTDTTTAIKRGSASGLASLVVGDKLAIQATCATATTCKATRIYATATPTPTPTPKPSPVHNTFTVTGVVVSATGSTLSVVVVKADDGDDNPLVPKSVIGTQFPVLTDTSTVATKAGITVPVSSLTTGFPAVTASGTCTTTGPLVCTAKRITVLVPTA